MIKRRRIWQGIELQCLAGALLCFQGALDAAVETVSAFSEGFAAKGDELSAVPVLYQQAAHQGVEGLFRPFRPNFLPAATLGPK